MKAAYFAIPLATAFGVVSLPAGAETRLGLELVRIKEGAVKPLPVFDDIQSSRTQSLSAGQESIENLIVQSNPSGEGGPSGVRNISPADTRFSVNFECSLAGSVNEVLLVKEDDDDDDTNDEVVKTYRGDWQLSNDDSTITFDIGDVEKVPGEVYRFDFDPAAPCERTDERRFRVPAVAATTGGGIPGWVPVTLLLVGAGVGLYFIFKDDGGNGNGNGNGNGGNVSR